MKLFWEVAKLQIVFILLIFEIIPNDANVSAERVLCHILDMLFLNNTAIVWSLVEMTTKML